MTVVNTTIPIAAKIEYTTKNGDALRAHFLSAIAWIYGWKFTAFIASGKECFNGICLFEVLGSPAIVVSGNTGYYISGLAIEQFNATTLSFSTPNYGIGGVALADVTALTTDSVTTGMRSHTNVRS
jgi:hypothetical protein